MPWCTGCDRFLPPSTVTPTGECPRCGATVDPGRARAADAAAEPGTPLRSEATPEPTPEPTAPAGVADADEVPLPIPWHFKLLVGAIALYLGWRAFQGIDWLLRQL